MSDFTMPVFKFNKADVITAEELEKAKTDSAGGGVKRLKPGNHDLKVISATAHKQNANDPTWYSYKVVLANAEGTEMVHYAMVPTVSPRFNKVGGKSPLFLFMKLVEFVNAVGENLPPNDLSIIGKLFGEGKLVGKTLNVDLGYEGEHIRMVERGAYQIVDKKDQPVIFAGNDAAITYPDYESARGDALNNDINLTNLGIVKLHQPKKAAKASEGWDE